MHLPDSPCGASLVLVHGGAFVTGSRRMPAIAALTGHLARSGVAVAAFDYRLIGRGGRWHEAVADARQAIAWWRDRAPRHGLDRDRIAVCGLSAGAAIAFSALCDGSPAARAIGVYGVYDLESPPPWAGALPSLLFRSRDRRVWRDASPVTRWARDIPVLLLHGEADGTVPVSQSVRMAEAIAARGGEVRLRTWPDEPHAFLADPRRPAWSAAVDEVLAFTRGAPSDED